MWRRAVLSVETLTEDLKGGILSVIDISLLNLVKLHGRIILVLVVYAVVLRGPGA